jgi:hypothetical protein
MERDIVGTPHPTHTGTHTGIVGLVYVTSTIINIKDKVGHSHIDGEIITFANSHGE